MIESSISAGSSLKLYLEKQVIMLSMIFVVITKKYSLIVVEIA